MAPTLATWKKTTQISYEELWTRPTSYIYYRGSQKYRRKSAADLKFWYIFFTFF